MAEEAILFFEPVIILGIILGLYELILIHRDESFRGSHWLGHGLHSIIIMMVALFAVFNWDYFLGITTLGQRGIPGPLLEESAAGWLSIGSTQL